MEGVEGAEGGGGFPVRMEWCSCGEIALLRRR